MKIDAITTDTYGEGVYAYFKQGAEGIAAHYTVEEYEKAGFPKLYIEKLKRLGESGELIPLDCDMHSPFSQELTKVTMKLFKESGKKICDFPSIFEAGKLTRYLFFRVMESDSNMGYIDSTDIPEVEEELGSSWKKLVKRCRKDIAKFHLSDLIELGDEKIETNAYGNLQTMFRYDL